MDQQAYDAERLRLTGETEAAFGHFTAAATAMREAIEIATRQGLGWHRMRAALALARLPADVEACAETRDVLTAALAALGDGESCPEVREARGWLAAPAPDADDAATVTRSRRAAGGGPRPSPSRSR